MWLSAHYFLIKHYGEDKTECGGGGNGQNGVGVHDSGASFLRVHDSFIDKDDLFWDDIYLFLAQYSSMLAVFSCFCFKQRCQKATVLLTDI